MPRAGVWTQAEQRANNRARFDERVEQAVRQQIMQDTRTINRPTMQLQPTRAYERDLYRQPKKKTIKNNNNIGQMIINEDGSCKLQSRRFLVNQDGSFKTRQRFKKKNMYLDQQKYEQQYPAIVGRFQQGRARYVRPVEPMWITTNAFTENVAQNGRVGIN